MVLFFALGMQIVLFVPHLLFQGFAAGAPACQLKQLVTFNKTSPIIAAVKACYSDAIEVIFFFSSSSLLLCDSSYCSLFEAFQIDASCF